MDTGPGLNWAAGGRFPAFMASGQASVMTGTTVNLTMGALDGQRWAGARIVKG